MSSRRTTPARSRSSSRSGPRTTAPTRSPPTLAAADPRVRRSPTRPGARPTRSTPRSAPRATRSSSASTATPMLPDDYLSVAVRDARGRPAPTTSAASWPPRAVTPFEQAVAARDDLQARRRRRRASTPAARRARPTPSTSACSAARRWSGSAATTSTSPRAQDWEMNHRIRADRRPGLVPRPRHARLLPPAAAVQGARQAVLPLRPLAPGRRPHHEGTINLRYLAPPTMVGVTTAATSRFFWAARLDRPGAYAAGVTAGGLAISGASRRRPGPRRPSSSRRCTGRGA